MVVFRDLWLRWKKLRLPWRKQFFVGQDLLGNTYWEFKDALNSGRLRRIARYTGKVHNSDVQVSPQWHQWLRHTRPTPPSLQEQTADVSRQIQLKHNARLADERWANKAKYIDGPKPPSNTQPAQLDESVSKIWNDSRAQNPSRKVQETAQNPGSDWQPAAWTPDLPKR